MDDEALIRTAADSLSLISDLVEEKRAKIKQNCDYLIIKENEINIEKNNAIYFTISTNISSQLPQRLFTNCRTLSPPHS